MRELMMKQLFNYTCWKVIKNSNRIRNPAVCISGTVDKVYSLVSCSKGPDDNYKNSFLTIQSKQGLMFGVINIVGTKSRIAILIKECILNQTLSKTFIRSLATFFFISISITNKKGHKHHNSLLLIQLFSFQAISVLYLWISHIGKAV